MSVSSKSVEPAGRAAPEGQDQPAQADRTPDRQLIRWGGLSGLVGVLLLIGAAVVVMALGLPDASDPETLTDFTDIESGRIAEHFLYLGALVLFACHAFVLRGLLRTAHPAATLFGTVMAAFGLVIMAAGSMLHVSTSPLADSYNAPDASPEDQQAIEYSWQAAQSVFDTLLTTGVLLVPIGLALFGVAMRNAPAFGPRLAWLSIGLGTVGFLGAAIEAIAPGTDLSVLAVLAIAVFNVSVGWRTLGLGTGRAPLSPPLPRPDGAVGPAASIQP